VVADSLAVPTRWLICEGERLKEAKIGGFLGSVMRFPATEIEILHSPGEGTYAVVYRGQSLATVSSSSV